MKITKNCNLDSIEVKPNGGGTDDVFFIINNHLDFAYIALNTDEARQIANDILKLCDELDGAK